MLQECSIKSVSVSVYRYAYCMYVDYTFKSNVDTASMSYVSVHSSDL